MILASASPRRRELIQLLSRPFEVRTAGVDETLPQGISPKEAVAYLSRIKAQPFCGKAEYVIGADTVVALGSQILGKPADQDNAFHILQLLSGKTHKVFTGVTVINYDKIYTFTTQTDVTFYDLENAQIQAYIATGEPMDKAGAYGIQGKGSLLVKEICGDYFNVVGLPVSRLGRVLAALEEGVDPDEFI